MLSRNSFERVVFKCPKCGKMEEYFPNQEDIEKIKLTGLASATFDHRDHALLIYFDAYGSVRGWHVYESEAELVALGLANWRRVNKWKRKPNLINLLVATENGLRYSDIYWHHDVDWVLNYISGMKKGIVKLRKNEIDTYVFNTKPIYYAIAGKDLNLKDVGKLGKFFYTISKRYEDEIVDDEAVQRVMVSVVYGINMPLIVDEAVELINDLREYAKIKVKWKLLGFLIKSDEDFSRVVSRVPFLMRGGEDRVISLRELIETMSLSEINHFIKIYYKLKKLKVIKLQVI